jgi:hypothetical protein
LPQDQAWDAFNNLYNRRAYERICNEFGVDVNSDWRQKQSNNQGLGTVFNYWTRNGYHVVEDGAYHAEKMSFTQTTTNDVLHIDYIAQGSEADAAWTTFILDKSSGYTRPGVERINDSIRTYVWAILGAQGQTRTNILGTGLAFDAQKQFLVNVEGAISSPVDVPSSIERYQKVLQYAREKVDYVFGYDLYMSPGDMQLRIGKIEGYNNLIVTATKDMQLGSNTMVNATATPPTVVSARTGALPAHHDPEPPQPNVPAVATTAAEVALANQHHDEKTALTVGLIVTGLFFLWYCGRPHHS